MRSDLVKAAAILGVLVVLASVVLVVGMRWAIGSALASHLPGLNETLSQTGQRLETSVESSATRLIAGVDTGAGEVSAAVSVTGEALATTVEGSTDQLDRSLNEQMRALDGTLAAGSLTINRTIEQAFEEPMLISAPRGLPIHGAENGAPPVRVQASISGLGGGGNGEDVEDGESGN